MEAETTPLIEPQPSGAPGKRIGLVWPLLAVGLIVGGLWLFERVRREDAAGAAESPAPTVAVAKADREDLLNTDTIYAEFRPYLEAELNAKVSGYLKVIQVDFGDKVKARQLLATLEVPELQDQLNNAIAVEQKDEADYTNAHLIYTRLSTIRRASPDLVAQQDVDTAEAKDSAALAEIAAAKADVGKYRTLVGYTNIVAPFDGVITWRYADPGALIQAGTASDTQARPLVRISDNYLLRLDLPVSVDDVRYIHLDDLVDVRVQSLGYKLFAGKVTRFTDQVNHDTRTMITEIEVPNPNLELVPGMYAAATFKLGQSPRALAVPIQAVSLSRTNIVYVVNAGHEIEKRIVTVGLETPTRCEITSGLKEGEMVIIGGGFAVEPGKKVETKAWEEPQLP